MTESLIFKPRRQYANGQIEDSTYTPLGAMSGEEKIILSTEDHEVLNYIKNYKKASVGECSWWDVYSTQEEVDTEIALQERTKSAQKIILKIELDSDFKNGIILKPKPGCAFKCARAGFAAKITNIKVTIEYEE